MRSVAGPGVRVLVPALVLAACFSIDGVDADPSTEIGPPPFTATVFLDPDIITAADPTALVDVSSTGVAPRRMYDRRINNWILVDAYLFRASFSDGLATEIQINPEFGSAAAALAEARTYAQAIGRLPTALRRDVETVWIHMGTAPFGGGGRNLLIHTGQADLYVEAGVLEEAFVHEAAHTSLDAAHATAPGWRAAQNADRRFISTYARESPEGEDIAESFLPWLAVRYKSSRITTSLAAEIIEAIPNRLAYFDGLGLDMRPIQ